MQTIFPEACPETEALLSIPKPPPMAALGGSLVNELDAIDTPFVLALDDYRRIEQSSEVHRLMGRLLEHPLGPCG